MLIYNQLTELLVRSQFPILLVVEVLGLAFLSRLLNARKLVTIGLIGVGLCFISLIVVQGSYGGSFYHEKLGWPFPYYEVSRDLERSPAQAVVPSVFRFDVVHFLATAIFWLAIPWLLMAASSGIKSQRDRLLPIGLLMVVLVLSIGMSLHNRRQEQQRPIASLDDRIIEDVPLGNPPGMSPSFVDSALKLSLHPSSDFMVVVGKDPSYGNTSFLPLGEGETTLAPVRTTFVLDEQPYQGTNLFEAWVSLSASAAGTCSQMRQGDQNVLLDKQMTINGVLWYYGRQVEGAAGTDFETMVYHTLSGANTCVELSATIARGNIGNWEPGTVEEVNETVVKQQLQELVETAQFISA